MKRTQNFIMFSALLAFAPVLARLELIRPASRFVGDVDSQKVGPCGEGAGVPTTTRIPFYELSIPLLTQKILLSSSIMKPTALQALL
jgi:hypothetical protein